MKIDFYLYIQLLLLLMQQRIFFFFFPFGLLTEADRLFNMFKTGSIKSNNGKNIILYIKKKI